VRQQNSEPLECIPIWEGHFDERTEPAEWSRAMAHR
jgi:hypothetical protein